MRALLDATRPVGRGWPGTYGPVRLPITLVEYGEWTRTVWYERLAATAECWVWYGPGRAYVPTYWED